MIYDANGTARITFPRNGGTAKAIVWVHQTGGVSMLLAQNIVIRHTNPDTRIISLPCRIHDTAK